jgi:hypothetical protein
LKNETEVLLQKISNLSNQNNKKKKKYILILRPFQFNFKK